MHRLTICLILTATLPALAQDMRLTAAAKDTLARAQTLTFDTGVEYCGLLAVIPNGRLIATRPTQGQEDTCLPAEFSSDVTVVASYHTHGTYNPDALAELPSTTDVLADRAEGIDGFVATPGGRFWYIDAKRMIVRQLCDPACLPVDPDFEPNPDLNIKRSYTLDELRNLEG